MKFPARHFAARFAAKEALSKAFGTGIGKSMGWRDLDVQKKESGEPFVVLSGGAEKMARERGVDKIWISSQPYRRERHGDDHSRGRGR